MSQSRSNRPSNFFREGQSRVNSNDAPQVFPIVSASFKSSNQFNMKAVAINSTHSLLRRRRHAPPRPMKAIVVLHRSSNTHRRVSAPTYRNRRERICEPPSPSTRSTKKCEGKFEPLNPKLSQFSRECARSIKDYRSAAMVKLYASWNSNERCEAHNVAKDNNNRNNNSSNNKNDNNDNNNNSKSTDNDNNRNKRK